MNSRFKMIWIFPPASPRWNSAQRLRQLVERVEERFQVGDALSSRIAPIATVAEDGVVHVDRQRRKVLSKKFRGVSADGGGAAKFFALVNPFPLQSDLRLDLDEAWSPLEAVELFIEVSAGGDLGGWGWLTARDGVVWGPGRPIRDTEGRVIPGPEFRRDGPPMFSSAPSHLTWWTVLSRRAQQEVGWTGEPLREGGEFEELDCGLLLGFRRDRPMDVQRPEDQRALMELYSRLPGLLETPRDAETDG